MDLDLIVKDYFSLMVTIPDVWKKFQKGRLLYTHQASICGLYDLTKDMKSQINKLQEGRKARVIHVIKGTYNLCGDLFEMESYILQGTDKNDEYSCNVVYNLNDRESLREYGAEVFAYVKNITAPDLSEYGYITTKGRHGGIVRIY
jgi:hypothetical protein